MNGDFGRPTRPPTALENGAVEEGKGWLLRKQPLSPEEKRWLLTTAVISVAIGLNAWTTMFHAYGLASLGPFAYMASLVAVSVVASPICAVLLLIVWVAQKLDAARSTTR